MLGDKTIVVEDKLRAIFDYLPQIKGFKPVFKAGDEKELLAFFKQSQQVTSYPLIWLVMPYSEDHVNRRRVELMDISFILAVQTNSEMLNAERLDRTFKPILYPLLDNVLDVLTIASTTEYDGKFKVTKYANYSDEQTEQAGVEPDLWDAIKLNLDLKINNNCLRKIKI